VHSVECIYLRQRCFDASKPCVAPATRAPMRIRFFPDVIKFRVAVQTLWEKANRFRHPNYAPDRAQKLISSSICSDICRHATLHPNPCTHFGVILDTDRPTNRQTNAGVRAKTYTSFVVGGKQEVKVIWQKAPHGGPIPRLGVTPGGRKLYHWIPGVGFPISVP